MCHGLIEQRACNVSIPDLLRAVSYQEPDDDMYAVDVIDFPSVDGSESDVLQSESGLVGVKDNQSIVKKFDSQAGYDQLEADALSSTGFLATWFDCIDKDHDDLLSAADPILPTKPALLAAEVPKDTCIAEKAVPKSKKKSRKSEAVKEHIHAQHDSGMEDEDPVLIDEKRKRRMSSNRASAQRSRQRKQDRLDELEILTAQLRLENATLSRRAKLAEELAKKYQTEKSAMAKKMEELRQDLEAARRPRPQDSTADSGDEIKDVNSAICHIVDPVVEPEASSKCHPTCCNVAMNISPKVERNTSSSADLSGGILQELFEAMNSDQFDVSLGDDVPDLLEEEWMGSFTDCLNALP